MNEFQPYMIQNNWTKSQLIFQAGTVSPGRKGVSILFQA